MRYRIDLSGQARGPSLIEAIDTHHKMREDASVVVGVGYPTTLDGVDETLVKEDENGIHREPTQKQKAWRMSRNASWMSPAGTPGLSFILRPP